MVPLASVKFLPYWTQLDMNFLKVFNVGSWRYEARWEFFNMMNNGVELENTFNHSRQHRSRVPVPVGLGARGQAAARPGHPLRGHRPLLSGPRGGPSLISGRGPTLLPPGSGESSSPGSGFFCRPACSLQAVDAHPPSEGRPSGLWGEVAIDGRVLFDRDRRISAALARIRRAVAGGRFVRRVVHEQPYWTETL